MNTNNSRPGVYVLDDADLKRMGPEVAGGQVSLIFGAVTCLAEAVTIASAAVSLTNFCIDKERRKAWWAMFMSNFNRGSAADVAEQVSDNLAAAGAASASLTVAAAEAVLENTQVTASAAITKVTSLMAGDIPGPASCRF